METVSTSPFPVIEADSAVIVDGIQRSAAMMLFRYGNYRITSVVEKPVIERDDIALDMRGAAYDELPLQFRRIFDSYKLRVVTITGSNIDTGRLIRIYNRHSKLNITQHGLTYLGQYAEGVRVAAMSGFFRNCMEYSDDERRKGLYERIVCEAVAWLFHREYAELNFTNMCDRLREHMSYDELAEELAGLDGQVVLVGDGVDVAGDVLKEQLGDKCVLAPAHIKTQRAGSVALLAKQMADNGEYTDADELKPDYLRPSQAEREKAQHES